MIRIAFSLFLISIGCHVLQAAQPDWSVDPADFSNSMVMVGVIKIDGAESIDENDLVAAFDGTEVVGVASLQYESSADRYFAYLLIYGNTSGHTLNFKVYDADTDQEITVLSTEQFQINGSIGNLGSPYIWSDAVLSSESDLLSFTFESAVSDQIVGDAVMVTVPYSVDLSSLSALFSVSAGASIFLEDVAQVSGGTVNDFSTSVIYKVVAENGSDFSEYQVSVALTQNPAPTGIELTSTSIVENNETDAVVATMSALDDVEDSHVYILVSGTGDTHNSLFAISSNQVLAKTVFDYESRSDYSIRVKVTDSGNQSFERTIDFTITDVNEAPVLSSGAFTLPEHSAVGTLITTVSGTDPEDDVLSYSMMGGGDVLTIASTSGALTVSDASLLDFETTPQFVLVVTVSDGDLSDTATLIVNLTNINESTGNLAPTVSDQIFSIPENSVSGYFVGSILGTDPEGSPLIYTLSAEDTTSAFSLDSTSGVLLVEDQGQLDYETVSSFTLTVVVSDGELSDTAAVTVNLTDVSEGMVVNQAPTLQDQTFTVNEQSIEGFVIGILSGTDPDGDELSYSLLGGDNTFSLNASTGALSVLTSTTLDFETTPQFVLTAIVSDGSLFDSAVLVINLLDIDESVNQAPQISSQIFSLTENSPVSTIVDTVRAGDPDGDQIEYTLTDGSTVFELEKELGILRVLDSAAIDFEVNSQFILNVMVSDGTLNASATIIINVLDEAEEINAAPVFADRSFTLPENSPESFYLGTLEATDADDDQLSYHILSGNEAGGFSLDTLSGVLIVADQLPLDFETTPVFNLIVVAADQFLSDTATVTIQLTDVDEFVNQSPEIEDQIFSIDEHAVVGTVVGTLSASDIDGDVLIYSLVESDNVFTINAASGAIIVLSGDALDFETSPTFGLVVNVSDGSLSSSSSVTINLIDVDENVLGTIEPSSLEVFPNPSIDIIHVKSSEKILKVDCYDLNGRRVLTTEKRDIDVSQLETGMYVLHVHQESQVEVKRFIKQ